MERAALVAILGGRLGSLQGVDLEGVFTPPRDEILRMAAKARDAHGGWPSLPMIHALSKKAEIRGEVAHLLAVEGPDIPVAAGEIRDYLRKVALNRFAMDAAEAVDDALIRDTLRSRLDEALNLGEPEKPPYLYGKEDPVSRHEERKDGIRALRVSTGLRKLDDLLGGGIGGGELTLVLAPTKRGKSHVAVWLGAQALRGGLPVTHITLELSDRETACRYDRCLTGWNELEITSDPEGFRRRLSGAVDPSLLEIRFFPRFSVGVSKVEEILKRRLDLVGGPVALVLDYGMILRPPRGSDERRFELARIHESLSSLAQREGVPIVSPYQTNRTGHYTPKLGMEHMGESYEVGQHADIVISLETLEGEKDEDRYMKIVLAASRHTPEGSVMVVRDWGRSTLKEVDTHGS